MQALVTGGAGFIGSNLVERLAADEHAVRVLDDLSTGYRHNVPSAVDLVHGNVADGPTIRRALEGVDVVFHQAAHRSVFRSVEHPLDTDTANVHGTLTLLDAMRSAGIKRLVYASSSSVYGGAPVLPTAEDAPTQPRSPYAVSKLAAEHYCRVFTELYGLQTIALRYFNVYGPRQRPDSAYAAVVPLFIDALRSGKQPVIHGDGQQTRDFTFVDDVVAANLAAATAPGDLCAGRVYNVAGGQQHSVLELLAQLADILGVAAKPEFSAPRAGDVRHTRADIEAAHRDLGYQPTVGLAEGLRRTVSWFSADAPSP
jgi:UDP-glucose 4-epimerase